MRLFHAKTFSFLFVALHFLSHFKQNIILVCIEQFSAHWSRLSSFFPSSFIVFSGNMEKQIILNKIFVLSYLQALIHNSLYLTISEVQDIWTHFQSTNNKQTHPSRMKLIYNILGLSVPIFL